MNSKPTITSKNSALRLRNSLNQLSNISYSFSKLNKEYPIDTLDQQGIEELINSYHQLLQDAVTITDSYKKDLQNPQPVRHENGIYKEGIVQP